MLIKQKSHPMPDEVLLVARMEAEDRRKTREEYYHWQERDLRIRLAIYTDIVTGKRFPAEGRTYYKVRIAMIRNELKARKAGP